MRGRVALLAGVVAVLGGAVLGQEAEEKTPVEAPPVSVKASASASEVTVGETFFIDLKAMGPPGTTWRFPAGVSEDEIELRTSDPGATGKGDAPEPEPGAHRYEAAVFALGEVKIPPIPVRYRLPDGKEGEIDTEPLIVEVGSLLPRDADEQKLADIRGPRPVGIGAAFWVALAVALVLLGTLLTWLLRRRRPERKPEAAAVPRMPPDAEALRALDALAASGLLEARAFREFYIRLTAVAKLYLERRLEAPVLEMTTSETLAFLRGHAHGGEVLPVFRDLAGAADQIKFARGEGLAEAAERHLSAVRGLVSALEARLRPAEIEGPEEGKAA
jgi:hypothetical protein